MGTEEEAIRARGQLQTLRSSHQQGAIDQQHLDDAYCKMSPEERAEYDRVTEEREQRRFEARQRREDALDERLKARLAAQQKAADEREAKYKEDKAQKEAEKERKKQEREAERKR